MDTSKEYIEMCDCPEIQGRWHELLSTGDETDVGIVCGFEEYYSDDDTWELKIDDSYFKSKNLIWLPRQDQLQDMVDSKQSIFFYNNKAFTLKENFEGRSYEQLWLQIVMYEKYGKKWDDNDWVKEGIMQPEPKRGCDESI
jgi:hypothetical protein